MNGSMTFHFVCQEEQILLPLISFPSQKRPVKLLSTLKGKNLREANSYFSGLSSNEKGVKKVNGRVASPESVPIHLGKCNSNNSENNDF